ncbi:MAG: thiolase family protein [Myxococcota bacterium]
MSTNKVNKEVWIIGAKRTPFGALGGCLKSISAIDLGVAASKASIAQAEIRAEDVDQTVLGNVQQTSPDAIYGGRHVALKAGVPIDRTAITVNRLCGSGFQALITAAEQILLGESNCVLAAGAENMSQAPHAVWGLRDASKLGRPPQLVDTLWESLTDSYCNTSMAVTAENVAEYYEITREESDAFALESQRRWARADQAGQFDEQIVPLEVRMGRNTVTFDRDEHPRPETTGEALARLPALFKEGGIVTAGNASGISDGAAALVVADRDWAVKRGLRPLAKVVQWGVVGVEPKLMGIGPVPAIRKVLDRAGRKLADVDLFDINEAFASQFLAVQKELGLSRDKTNIRGGAIALGHPLGATGTRIIADLIYALRQTDKRIGVGAACIGGGQGIAVLIEGC